MAAAPGEIKRPPPFSTRRVEVSSFDRVVRSRPSPSRVPGMPEQRSVLKELRDLDQKRLTQGLSPDEQARFAQLRELAGSAAAAGTRPGFDVNAAAAALRESLMPAGLRHRPPVARNSVPGFDWLW